MESLLGQSGGEPDETRERHPDGSWRADALGRSRHARLAEQVREPLDDRDPETARRVCAEVCRELLGDFAPALVWVAGSERLRCQVLATWLRSLFDFARQPGIEGERLAALNRLEFSLEQSLGGSVVAQPVYVAMALEEARRPWPRPALETLLAAARRRVLRPRLAAPDEVEADTEELAGAICDALWDAPASERLVAQVAALLRLRGLLDLGHAMRRDQATLSLEDLPATGDPRRPLDRGLIDGAVRGELERLLPSLRDASATAAAPPEYRAALRFLRLAGLELAERTEALGWEVTSRPPRLGLGGRLALLARSRFGW